MTIIARTPAVPKLNALLNSSSGTFIWRAGGVSPLILRSPTAFRIRGLTPPARQMTAAASAIPPFHHRNLIAGGVVFYMVHERLNEQKPAAADLAQVGWIGRIGQQRGVKTISLVRIANVASSSRHRGDEMDAAVAVRLLIPAFLRQTIVAFLVVSRCSDFNSKLPWKMELVSASCRATPSSIRPLGSHNFMRVRSPSRWLTSGATMAASFSIS